MRWNKRETEKVFNKFDTKSLNGNDPAISKLPVIVLNHFPGDSKKFRLRPKVRNLGTIGVNDSASKDMGSITYLEPKDNDWAFTIYANNEDTDAADWSRLQSYFADTLLSNKLSITPVVFKYNGQLVKNKVRVVIYLKELVLKHNVVHPFEVGI